jgi:hypothetical protein
MFAVASLPTCWANPKAVENVPEARQTDWRNALHAEFKYIPVTLPNPAVPPKTVREAPPNPNVVVLAKYVVRDAAPGLWDLGKVFRDEEEDARSETLNKKIGFGTYTFRHKKTTFGFKTLFFIPIEFGGAR